MPLLEVKALQKHFEVAGGTLHAVDGVTFSVERGKTLGVVGESGCGKSTMGKTVLRLTEPTAGDIWFEGKEISKLPERAFFNLRTEMQMIFQDPFSSLDPRMNVTQLISEPLVIHQVTRDKAELKKRVREMMDTVGIASRFAGSYPHEMDGGRRQRVGIARALSLQPKLLVCDEPVSALDVSIQAQVLNLLQDLQKEQGLTYLFITHDLSVVRHISDEICVMYLGRVVEKSDAKELFRRALHPYTQALLSAILVPSQRHNRKQILLKGELTSPINPGQGCRFAPRCPYAADICHQRDPELMDHGDGHTVACHRTDEISGLKATENL